MDLFTKAYVLVGLPVMAVIFAGAAITFGWGLVELLANMESADAKQKGGRHILFGIIGMFLISSVYTFVTIVGNTVAPGKTIPFPSDTLPP